MLRMIPRVKLHGDRIHLECDCGAPLPYPQPEGTAHCPDCGWDWTAGEPFTVKNARLERERQEEGRP